MNIVVLHCNVEAQGKLLAFGFGSVRDAEYVDACVLSIVIKLVLIGWILILAKHVHKLHNKATVGHHQHVFILFALRQFSLKYRSEILHNQIIEHEVLCSGVDILPALAFWRLVVSNG